MTLNDSFLDYKMPRSTDVPDIKVIDIITNDPMVYMEQKKRLKEVL